MLGILEITDKKDNSRTTYSIQSKPVILGRSPACDTILDSPEVSRRHCMIELRGGKYWLVDLASANGTFINAVQAKEKVLNTGDMITIGKTSRWEVRFIMTSDTTIQQPAHHDQMFSDDTTQKTRLQKNIKSLDTPHLKHSSPDSTVSDNENTTTPYATKDPLDTLLSISRILMSSLDLDRLLELMMEQVMNIISADKGCVVMNADNLGAVDGELIIKAYKQKANLPRSVSPELQISRTIVKQAIEQQEALLLGDIENNDKYNAAETIIRKGIRSSMCVPMKGKDRVLGVIYLDSGSTTNPFSENDLDLIIAIANQAGMAVESALLWEKMRRYNEELEQEVSQRTQEISLERNRLQAILRCMGEGVIVSDTADKITLINPAASKILDIQRDTTLTYNVLSWFPKEVHKMAMKLYERAKDPAPTDTLFEEIKIAIEDKHIRLNMAPIRDEANHYLGMVLVNQDITHEVEVERMKADFISMLTHDLKNPLTVILTSAQLIIKGYLGPISPKMESQIRAMNRNAQTMLELVNNFLDVSKIEAGKMTLGRQPMNIMDLVDNVIQNFSNQTEELGIDLVKEIQDANIPVMTCDPFQIERVLSNLVSNAIKFTSKPGHVIVRVGVEKDNMILSVSDSGEGIPKDELPSLFSRYFRTQKVQGKIKGTGLGLYIVKSITEAHGGEVGVESELHKGTTFYVRIPIVPPETGTAFS